MNNYEHHRILLVDDETNILESFQRSLRGYFSIETAKSGERALALLEKEGPFSVIITDMRMPSMNGIELLKRVQSEHPSVIRLMLTGNAESDTAIEALHEGGIFRFLTKPCSTEVLEKALRDSIRQYEVEAAERELLQNTLSGTVRMLTDLLSVVDPVGASECQLLREQVRVICRETRIANGWEVELAAMLSSIGRVTLPAPLLIRLYADQRLSEEERRLLHQANETGYKLVSSVPRLQGVATIIRFQDKNYDGSGIPENEVRSGTQLPFGSRLLKILKQLNHSLSSGSTRSSVFRKLTRAPGLFDARLVDELQQLQFPLPASGGDAASNLRTVHLSELREGMTLIDHIVSKDGTVIAAAGFSISQEIADRVKNYRQFLELVEPVRVLD